MVLVGLEIGDILFHYSLSSAYQAAVQFSDVQLN